MRATSTVVVFSSLLLAASVAAGPNKKTAKKTPPAATAGSAAQKTPPATTAGSAAQANMGSGAAAAGSAAGGNVPQGGGDTAGSAAQGAGSPDPAAVKPEDMPTAIRMRRLEQQTQALKERAWQLKARVQMLREQMLGGGAGAQAVVAHGSEMGASFRLIKLIYSLDGAQVFARTDDTAESLYKTKAFDVFAGPISPGNHNLSVIATYRGHGYGVFEYLSKYTFTARGSQAFTAIEGKIAKIDCKGVEKGGPTTPLEKRAAITCKVTQVQPERAAERAAERPGATTTATPGTPPRAGTSPTPAPGTTPASRTAPAPTGTTPGK
jgi:hypothetical protein